MVRTPEGCHRFSDTRSGCGNFRLLSGGLRYAATAGYYLTALQAEPTRYRDYVKNTCRCVPPCAPHLQAPQLSEEIATSTRGGHGVPPLQISFHTVYRGVVQTSWAAAWRNILATSPL